MPRTPFASTCSSAAARSPSARTSCTGRRWVVEVDLEGRRRAGVDCHVHVTGGGGEDGFSRVPLLALSRFVRRHRACVGVLGRTAAPARCANWWPRRWACASSLSAWCYTGSYQYPPITLTGSVRDDIVFIDPVIGVGEFALSDHRSSQPTLGCAWPQTPMPGMISGKSGFSHLHMGDGSRGFELIRRALDESGLPARPPPHINRRKALFAEALKLNERALPMDVTAFQPTMTATALPSPSSDGSKQAATSTT